MKKDSLKKTVELFVSMHTKCLRNLSFVLGLILSVLLTSCDKDDLFIADVDYETEQSDGTMIVEAWASEYKIEIKSDGDWYLETDDRFFHPYPNSGSGNSTILLDVETNQSEERKVGSLTIVFPGHEELNKTILIEQKWEGDYDDNAADKITTSNKIYAVGYSYDATGEWASPNSVKIQIFNTKKLFDEEKLVLGPTQVSLVENTITGSSISDMTNALAVKADVKGGFGKFKAEANASFDMNHAKNSNYEYATTYFNLDVRSASFDVDVETLCDFYMTDDAWYAINGVPRENDRTHKKKVSYPSTPEGFKKLMEYVGSHVIVSAKLGGRVRHSMEIDISKITSSYDVKAFAKASYDGVFASGGGSVDEKFKQSYEDNRKNINIRLNVLGGDESKAKALGSNSGFTKDNLDAWVQSVTDVNMALIDFDKSSLIPIYELVDTTLTVAEDGVDGKIRKQMLQQYMTGAGMAEDFSSYDCGTVTEFEVPIELYVGAESDGNETLVYDITIDGQYVGQICREYIPNINRDGKVTVVYPVINNVPRYNMGFFIGNNSHKPARVAWDGTNVTIQEYADLNYMFDAPVLYLRGASISTEKPEGTIHVRGTVSPSYLKLNINHLYPLVKIFNKVWTRRDYRETSKSTGVPMSAESDFVFTSDGSDGIVYYSEVVVTDKELAPVGWRVPSSTDYIEIKNKLEANNLTNIGRFFLEENGPGKLGYAASFYGWWWRDNTLLNGTHFNNGEDFTQAEYLTSDQHHIRIKKDGGFEVCKFNNSTEHYYMSIRLIKN